ncbi:MAG: MarR family winged helix-turn-helix transcriptional regulator [Granulosicoccus sp.]
MNGVENCFSFIVGKAMQSVSRRARELLAPHNVTPAQYAVLSAVCEAHPLTASELIQRLQIDTATLTGIVDRLEAAKMITRKNDTADRRVQLLFPTAKGSRAIGLMDESMDLLNFEISEILGSDKTSVLRGLKKLNRKPYN